MDQEKITIQFENLTQFSNYSDNWDELSDNCRNIELLFQSSQWISHLIECEPENDLVLAVVQNSTKQIVGRAPLRQGGKSLTFSIGNRVLWKKKLKSVFILGSQPLLPEYEDVYDSFFLAMSNKYREADCVYFDSIPMKSFCYNYLKESKFLRRMYHVYVPYGGRQHYLITLPETFEKFLLKFKRKKRYNLKRQIKSFQEFASGKLRLQRIVSLDQIDFFLKEATRVADNSWQKTALGMRINNNESLRKKYRDLAKRGIFRSYLLMCREEASSFVIGYQFQGVYHYIEIAYNRDYKKLSPGTVLLYMIIEDLIKFNPARKLNFGIGDAQYKRAFQTDMFEDVSVFLLNKTIFNKVLTSSHFFFREIVELMKTIMNKKKKGS
ncbi:MAG: GNAT family N-acetyltransferase [Thermodesulfovibrionia bacterium]|nr:GNAT family N-acetyltransferase [Thermodesulfovibrionia bacterium]